MVGGPKVALKAPSRLLSGAFQAPEKLPRRTLAPEMYDVSLESVRIFPSISGSKEVGFRSLINHCICVCSVFVHENRAFSRRG